MRIACLPLMLAFALGLVAPARAQDAPPVDENPQETPAAAAPAGSADTAQPDAADGEGDDADAAVEPADRFDPTEEVDEDYSIAYPVDI